MRQVDLGLDLVFDVSGAGRLRGPRGGIGASTQMLADQLGFMLFQ